MPKIILPVLRGGLAARALVLITQREKDDALWHHHQTSKLTNNASLREDLRVKVMEILQPIGESIFAQCQVCPADATRSRTVLVDDVDGSTSLAYASLVDVLLSQPGAKGIVAVESGMTIRLWRPWIEVDLDAARTLPSDGELVDDGQQQTHCDGGAECTKEGNPVCCPDEKSLGWYSKNFAHDRRARRALLCSRFVVG
jgi:hypothetical protein